MTDLARTRLMLIERALQLYPFRSQRAGESPRDYLAAILAHVEDHDWALAFEIEFGREQADWTLEDTAQFRERMLSRPRGRHTPPPGGIGLRVEDVESGGTWPVTEAAMREMLEEVMAVQLAHRTKKPHAGLPIIASVLLLDGAALLMSVTRNERIAVLKFLAQNGPVYGYVLVFDTFMHMISTVDRHAEKRDCILGHMGTRDGVRVIRRRPYRYVDDRRRIEIDPPMEDIVPGDSDVQGIEDPYAEIFVSVPTPPSVS